MIDTLVQLIQAGRERFTTDLGTTGQHFDATTWDMTSLARQLVRTRRVYLHFVGYGHPEEPLPRLYTAVVKSWLLAIRRTSVEYLKVCLLPVRLFWEVWLARHGGHDIVWSEVSAADLDAAEQFMRQRWGLSKTNKAMGQLLTFMDWLAAHGICHPIHYTIQTPRQRDFNNHTLAGQEARRAKLPSPRALEGLADLFCQKNVLPADRLRLAAVALLVVTGLRIGELLTMPLDCEVHERRNGQNYYGLRYQREKVSSSLEAGAVRWLSPVQAELAQEAVAEIRQLTAAPRARARVLEQHPDRVPLPGHHEDEWLTKKQLCLALGLPLQTPLPKVPGQPLRYRVEGRRYLYRVGDVEKYLLTWRADPLWTMRTGPNNFQLLSETLLLAYRNFFHSRKAIYPLLVEPLFYSHLEDFLAGRGQTASIFRRSGICEADGSPCRLTSHQFRHWLNDVADKGGLPVEVLTRWMGRSDARDTQDYRHATIDERLVWLKKSIREGTVVGFMTDVYHALPTIERDEFLNGQIQAVHVTPLGICVHDFAIEPCPYHLNCLRGCHHYLRTKGDERERANLIRVQEVTVHALARAREQAASERPALADAWIRHHEDTLRGIAAALAVDERKQTPDGTGMAVSNIEEKDGSAEQT
jgi:integrase